MASESAGLQDCKQLGEQLACQPSPLKILFIGSTERNAVSLLGSPGGRVSAGSGRRHQIGGSVQLCCGFVCLTLMDGEMRAKGAAGWLHGGALERARSP